MCLWRGHIISSQPHSSRLIGVAVAGDCTGIIKISVGPGEHRHEPSGRDLISTIRWGWQNNHHRHGQCASGYYVIDTFTFSTIRFINHEMFHMCLVALCETPPPVHDWHGIQSTTFNNTWSILIWMYFQISSKLIQLYNLPSYSDCCDEMNLA